MDFQGQFSMSKIIQIFLNFFFIEEYKFRSTFFVIGIFWYNKFLTTLLLKLGQIFDEVAKLGKSTQEAYNPGKWLIL